jgi:hypothetical protein
MSFYLSGKATTDGGTIITVPAGSSWRGSVAISQLTNTAGTFYPDITVQGTSADPTSGSAIVSVVGFGAVVGLVPMANSVSMSDVIISAEGANAITLQLNFHGCTAAVGTAAGYFQ